MKKIISLSFILSFVAMIGAGYYFLRPTGEKTASIIKSAAWAGKGTTLIMDPHTHSSRWDGSLSEGELLALARRSGCDVLAITDHTDYIDSVSQAQLDTITRLREQNNDLLLFLGLEINIPSYHGREHIGLLVSPLYERILLPPMRKIVEADNNGEEQKERNRALDENTLNMINAFAKNNVDLLMIYNHPSRKDENPLENMSDLITWQDMSPHFIGFEGAPGHQRDAETGGYQGALKTTDRWDPVVAEVGGAWDQSLEDGYNFWAALASSDYHSDDIDYAPCSFSRTHIEVSDRSYEAVLASLRAGTFWADMGGILDDYDFSAKIPGLSTPLYAGTIAQLDQLGHAVDISINLKRGTGAMNKPLIVEIISNCKSGKPEMIANETLSPKSNEFHHSLNKVVAGKDGDSCYIRSRVRLEKPDGPDLLAYSNPIRLQF